MSGHSKWSTIKHKKGRADAKRGKIFSSLSKEIIMAAKSGGKDVDANSRLRSAINAAKAVNMPNDNIDRAIKKGAGELGDAILEELSYEAYAPGGVAIMVDCLTDNRNRTAAEIRLVITRANGNLASNGSVAWMFHRKSQFVIEGEYADEENIMELCFNAGADVEDIIVDNDIATIIAPPEAFDEIVAALESKGIVAVQSSISKVPENEVQVTEIDTAKKIVRLLDALEENDDVQDVVSNANIDDAVLEKLAAED